MGESNHKLHEYKCLYCGRIFESQPKLQKFCSADCYYKYRFCRKEDASMVAECLKKGKKSEFVPNLIEEMVCGDGK